MTKCELRVAGGELRGDLQEGGNGANFGDIISDYVNDLGEGSEPSRRGGKIKKI